MTVRSIRCALGLAALLCLAACDGPFLMLPGGELGGEVVTEEVADWTFLDEKFVHLETRPDDPYSVELNYIVRDGELFIDPEEGRAWLDHLRADPRVRVRFGDKVYPLIAVLVGEPGELPGFDADRFIYRLDPRPAAELEPLDEGGLKQERELADYDDRWVLVPELSIYEDGEPPLAASYRVSRQGAK